ncbi:3-deoxy-D-manno-octulosonate 8-phosphate phosphatase [Vibrio coralliilyticus]|jgi:3-deoxy-D-manno-octulosonate 8-phosphate phosphatase (KDO 8-P phosphatase)|uniref:3-deoxy-D-manno-octulosonate 8-phosphate phosphatase KdsC n=1 Tax=Vibrio coralliilyticus TaxID=190893 RepID=A0A097QN79_9VIBR|nr:MULTISPECIES: 3-deoxy-manno-octulosonate-8-phosphatase KdsC [Vibrio]AIU67924.1 3-deoxy-D-manno-octulosonate 8-phosphate phosphatase [Vibrio coralliilyticus]AIW17719.1 3-deoxy-D-manno-octulosonate 8-phosphate phosphatase [Vibrio coralliilyticus]ARC91268.1 3-deoxy-D-manno-octulosonate 8-phosphate phosphatase [Vibrio coralliilyticus]EEX30828.1 3-deoxy-D-manno-octulosonate 8-phosphate phosphatase [Vibrio coralliilyticus ATCC BAA-450]KJY75064.1 3-deoxy-D-manno-octulosonate 8-phosphate phosphatas
MSKLIETLYKPVEQNTFNIAKEIKLLICDVDGVFSDGLVYMGNDGEELKTFHTRDGYGVKSLMNAGIEIAIITGRQSRIVENRMKALGISLIYQGQDDKVKAYQDICSKLNIAPEQTGYIGDDLIDWPVMEKVALKVCVADGHPLLAQRANYVTSIRGGHGAVREVCDLILQARNELDVHKGLSI